MNEKEREIIFLLAQKLTGAHPDGTFQHGIFITNIEKRMRETKHTDVTSYINFAKGDPKEYQHLISALSIHTTSWFRENPHYVMLQKIILNFIDRPQPYRVWSCACSTGEEAYSLALLFEEFRSFHPTFNYQILGTDIDGVSLETAKKAVYEKRHLTGPVAFYKKHVLLGSGPTENYFTFTKSLRSHCQFQPHDIRTPLKDGGQFDLIVIRNILIYFPADEVKRIITSVLGHLRPGGHLISGHSELIDYQNFGLELRGHSVYQKPAEKGKKQDTAQILRKPNKMFMPEAIVIGASTGGPQALAELLANIGAMNCPPVVIVQHIAPKFARGFAENVANQSGLKLGESRDGTALARNHVYVSELDSHIGIQKKGAQYILKQGRGAPINGHRPSVDYLFDSACETSKQMMAILLSGMGEDGAQSMKRLHDKGAYTMAQSEKDCVVYGMPKEAIEAKAVDFIGTASQMRDQLIEILRGAR